MGNLPDESKLQFQISAKLRTVCFSLIGVGLLLILLQWLFPWHAGHGGEGAADGANTRLYMSFHLALLVALPLCLGGLYFTAFNHAGGAAWNVTIRRVAENYVWYLPVLLLLMLVVFFLGFESVFGHWYSSSPEAHQGDHILEHKAGWLNYGFFVGRNILWVLLWFLFGFLFWKHSTGQDQDGDIKHTHTLAKLSAGFLIVFALTYSANSWDLSMSLEPHWFSTMWAVYTFSGLALTVFASLVLWVWYLKSSGYFGSTFNENHLHDLGKYLFGHSIFWAYIGVCQYMLIWYAHIPEETTFYHIRIYDENMQYNAWAFVTLLVPILRFILPFLLLIRRDAKRNMNYLAAVSILILLGQVVDMYWIAYPTLSHGEFVMFSWQELGPLFVVFGSFVLTIAWGLSRSSLIPKKDPRLEQCLHWHQ